MPKVSPIQTNFSTGEVSPLFQGRVETDRYKAALATCKNFLPTIQGGLARRPATQFVAPVKTGSSFTRLIPFEFSVTQAYILEFGNAYIRFYRNNGQIYSGMTPYEISSPYASADLSGLKFAQSADIIYITHPNYPPRTLSRTGHTSWTLTTASFVDGPYLPLNSTGTTLTPAATTGSIVVTASSTTGINNNAGFLTTDVGRPIRIKVGATWGYVVVRTYNSSTSVTCDVVYGLGGTTATAFWRLGTWSDTTGYPAAVTFHEDRLAFSGNPNTPQRMDLSNTSDYLNFAPSDSAGNVIATNALSFTFNSSDVNVVRWMISDEKGLVVGTSGGEWIVRPSSQSEALTPTNITAKKSTAYGSADIQAVQVGRSGLFVQRAGRKLREITYFYDVDGFRAPDLTVLAEHITSPGITSIAYQKEPQPFVWAIRSDGALVGVTYERDVDSFKAGWHRHQIGGVSDAAGNPAKVESIAVIPSADGQRQDLWMIVQRYVNGSVVRYVEFLTKLFDDSMTQKEAFFVDAGLSYDAPIAVTGVTIASPAVVTAPAHGLSNGNKILVSDVVGLYNPTDPTRTCVANTNSYTVSNVTTNTFRLVDISGNVVNTTGLAAYISGGFVRKYITTLSGLDHLEGQTIDILGDGAVQPSKVVTSGAITLAVAATTLHLGLGYQSDGQMLRLDAGAADGTSIGKTRRTNNVGFMMHRSLGLKIGTQFLDSAGAEDMDNLTFRTAADSLTRAPALFTGIRTENLEADYDTENQICFRQDQPLPCMILAIMPQLTTQDR